MQTSQSAPTFDKATSRNAVVIKLRAQNEKLKQELKVLTTKLEHFVDRSRQAKAPAPLAERDPAVFQKE